MSTTRRWGIALTVAAVAMWAAIVAAIVTMAPDQGTNIGATTLFVVAVPLTIVGLALLAGSRSPIPRQAGARPDQATAPTAPAARAAVWSLGLGVVGVLLGFVPHPGADLVVAVQLSATLVLGVLSVVLGGLALRRARRRGDGRGLALAGTVVGVTCLGLHGYFLPQLVGLLITIF